MSYDNRLPPMLASRDERIQSYLHTTRSTDDIVREVTTAFASDVARIMGDVGGRGAKGTPRDPNARNRRR